jgi:hypothetical protein
MKKLTLCITLLSFLVALPAMGKGRKQWTEKQAWEWQKRVGVIKGFNEPQAPYPGMTRLEMLQKAQKLGLNSVRFWAGGNDAERTIRHIRAYAADAAKCGMTISPVLTMHFTNEFDKRDATEQELQTVKDSLQKIIRALRSDKRIISYDIWNEPGNAGFDPAKNDQIFIRHLNCIAKMVEWCREENPWQAITCSIFWRGDIMNEPDKPSSRRAREVEAMMDVHNIHQYNAGDEHSQYFGRYIDYVRQLGNRPVLSTECLTRVNNSGLGRTLPTYAKKDVNFYLWGLYMCDANWDVKWSRTTYDPYEPGFHNLMRPDGCLIDARDVELIRDFDFTHGKDVDPGAEISSRWENDRAWRWMSPGPVMGKVFGSIDDAKLWLGSPVESDGTNSICVYLDYNKYKTDREGFFKELSSLLHIAGEADITVLPTLLTDKTATGTDEELARYEEDVVRRYYTDARIKAWNLYDHPGEFNTDNAHLISLVKLIFRYVRFAYPNQPVMATPWVSVKPFSADFDYRRALVHGTRNGWNKLDYSNGGSAYLTQLIWSLSDVTAFSSDQHTGECGWLKSIAYRYGRPIFCTAWQPADENDAATTLENFAASHVYWYQKGESKGVKADAFKFKPICTPH